MTDLNLASWEESDRHLHQPDGRGFCKTCSTRMPCDWSDALDDMKRAAERIDIQQAEIEKLESWKAEAMQALTHWDHVSEPVAKKNAKYLGWFKWDVVAVELDRQQAEIERLKDLAAHWESRYWEAESWNQESYKLGLDEGFKQ